MMSHCDDLRVKVRLLAIFPGVWGVLSDDDFAEGMSEGYLKLVTVDSSPDAVVFVYTLVTQDLTHEAAHEIARKHVSGMKYSARWN